MHEPAAMLIRPTAEPSRDLGAVDGTLAPLRDVVAGEDLDERGLARPVLAHQTVNLARRDRDVEVLQTPPRRDTSSARTPPSPPKPTRTITTRHIVGGSATSSRRHHALPSPQSDTSLRIQASSEHNLAVGPKHDLTTVDDQTRPRDFFFRGPALSPRTCWYEHLT